MRERNTMRLLHMGCGESLSSPDLTTYFPLRREKQKKPGKVKQKNHRRQEKP